MVVRRGLAPDLLRFLYDLLDAADWAMLPAMAENRPVVTRPRRVGDLAADFPEVVCESPEQLGAMLAGGFEAWAAHRGRAAGEPDGGPAPPSG